MPQLSSRLAARLAVCATLLPALAGGGAASTASASGRQAASPADERRLRAREERTIGRDHAADHARQRAVWRNPKVRARLARAGRRPVARASAVPSQDGQWAPPFDLETVAVHSALLPTGKMLFFNSSRTTPGAGEATVWDPRTGVSKRVDPPLLDGKPANIFCAGQSFLADGRLLVTGGQLEGNDTTEGTIVKGLNKVFTFNPFNETWTKQPDMREGRWYPSQVMLPDGRTVIMDGYDSSGSPEKIHNNDIEVFTPSPDLDGVGTIRLLGERVLGGGDATRAPAGALYPHRFTMPSGRTLVAGPASVDSWFLNPLGAGFDFSWTDAPNPAYRVFSTGVLLPKETPGSSQILITGGGDVAVQGTQTFDERTPTTPWKPAPPLRIGRSHHNTVLLPDGSMATVGGGVGSRQPERLAAYDPEQLQVELFDPSTQAWRLGPAQAKPRAYHSTAALLPDGRVLSAGDDTNGGVRGPSGKDTGEIYSPAYLFKGARPRIDSAPATLAYGRDFAVRTPDAATKAVLVAPAAVTHANDMNQRYVPLTLQRTGTCVTLTAPSGPTIAPPGYYMLFLLDGQGVPSVAKWVRIGPGAVPASTCAAPTPSLSSTPAPTATPMASGTLGVPDGGATGTAPQQPPSGGAGGVQPGAAPVLSLPSRGSLRTVRTRGLRVGFRCSAGCAVRAELTIDARTARRLRLSTSRRRRAPLLIGSGSARTTVAGDGRVNVRLTRSATRRLKATRRLLTTVRVRVTDASGRRTVRHRQLVLTR